MSYSYATVTIASNTYSVYGSLENADKYLSASLTAGGKAWVAASDTTKKQGLITSTRWFDSASWAGSMTDSTQDLAWPRKDIPDVADDAIPDDLVRAFFELSGMLLVDPDLQANLASPQVKEQHAGSAGQSFFRPREVQVLTYFPTAINQLVVQWLSSSGSGVVGAIPNDVCETSRVNDPYNFRHGI